MRRLLRSAIRRQKTAEPKEIAPGEPLAVTPARPAHAAAGEKRKTTRWWIALLLLAVLIFLPSVFHLEIFRRPLHAAVERHVGRPVEFRQLSARILPWPMVRGEWVRVSERPEFGAEPFLYAREVECTLPFRALWEWRLACSQIHFVEPSINLVRNQEQIWNLATFLLEQPAPSGTVRGTVPPPLLKATDARINFKLGLHKQVYTLTSARVLLQRHPEGHWRLQLEAVPTRSDLRLSETGRLHLHGTIGQATTFASLPFQIEAQLERGSLAQLFTFARGREPPLLGALSFALTAQGTPAAWSTKGSFTVAELRRWDLLASPRTPRWKGTFDLAVTDRWKKVEIRSGALAGQQSMIQLSGMIEEPFGERQWGLEARAAQLELEELLGQFASLKANVPAGAHLRGTAALSLLARGPVKNWTGELAVTTPSALEAPDLPRPAQLSGFGLRLTGGRLELPPTTIAFGEDGALTVAGELDLLASGAPYRLQWKSPRVRMMRLRQTAAGLGWNFFGGTRWEGPATIDLEWQGLSTERVAPRWRGEVSLNQVRFYPPEFNDAIAVLEARLRWIEDRVQIQPLRFQLGESTVAGTMERRVDSPWTVRLESSHLDLSALDELLNPVRRSLLARLIQTDTRAARRLQELAVRGDLRLDELQAGSLRLQKLTVQGEWAASELNLSAVRFRAYGGRFQGRLQAHFRGRRPHYRLAGNVRLLDLSQLLPQATELGGLFTGTAGAEMALETSGVRESELRRQLRGRIVGVVRDGTLTQVNLLTAMSEAAGLAATPGLPAGPTRLQSLAGDFQVAGEQVEFQGARMIVDGTALEISGRVGFDGRLELRLQGEPLLVAGREPTTALTEILSRRYRAVGQLRRPRIELVEATDQAKR